MVLGHELLRLNNGVVAAHQNIRGGLAAWQEKRIAEYINQHLLEDTSLRTLAEVARLSPYHFVRAFKQSFGLPPHRYLSKLRMDQAKSLLADPDISVTQRRNRMDAGEFSRPDSGLRPTISARSRQWQQG